MGDDGQLWERICRRDAQAFDSLYRTHGPKMQGFLRRVLGSRQAAEDVMQETFARIWEHPNGFQPERGTLRAYIFGAARKRAADWWRTRAGQTASLPDERAECSNEKAALMTDAISRLSEEGRALIWLREVEGYSYDELAQVFEVPEGTIASRLFSAREELRRIWQAAPPVPAKKGDA